MGSNMIFYTDIIFKKVEMFSYKLVYMKQNANSLIVFWNISDEKYPFT